MSRRLDWRFLLPDCTLGVVGYIGDPDRTFLGTLRIFSRELVVLAPDALADTRALLDVLVLKAPRRTLMIDACRLIRPGGHLYAEFDRIVTPLQPSTLLPPSVLAGLVRRSGLVDVEVNWHWPTFDRCTRIISLDQPAALALILSRGNSDLAARLRTATGRVLLASGILGWLIRSFSVVARKPEHDAVLQQASHRCE